MMVTLIVPVAVRFGLAVIVAVLVCEATGVAVIRAFTMIVSALCVIAMRAELLRLVAFARPETNQRD